VAKEMARPASEHVDVELEGVGQDGTGPPRMIDWRVWREARDENRWKD
jgi:hypothetical protein